VNAAHFHLIVNHLPIVGAVLSVPLLVLALFQRADRGALRAAVAVLVLSAGGALASLWSGEPAEEQVEHLPGTSEAAIEIHEERAELATGLSVVTALLGVGALVLAERRRIGSAAPIAVTLAGAVLTAGAMAWTGSTGGVIRHPEIRGGPAASAPANGATEAGRAPREKAKGDREDDND
jgi:hypothetical protein